MIREGFQEMGNEQAILQKAEAKAVKKDDRSRPSDAIPLFWNMNKVSEETGQEGDLERK